VDFFDGRHHVVASVLRDRWYCCPDADSIYSRWAARTRQSLKSLKGDPLEIGTSATIHTHGLAAALCTTSLTRK